MQTNTNDRQFHPEPRGLREEVKPIDEAQEFEPAPVERTVTGIVTDCERLYLREEAAADAAVLAIIPVLTQVVVDMASSTEAFYRVCTDDGLDGFCMKKYIAVSR